MHENTGLRTRHPHIQIHLALNIHGYICRKPGTVPLQAPLQQGFRLQVPDSERKLLLSQPQPQVCLHLHGLPGHLADP